MIGIIPKRISPRWTNFFFLSFIRRYTLNTKLSSHLTSIFTSPSKNKPQQELDRTERKPNKAFLLPSSLSFYTSFPAYTETILLLNDIFKQISPKSSMGLSADEIKFALLLDIPAAVKFPSELPKSSKGRPIPDFSQIFDGKKLDPNSKEYLFSLQNLLDAKSLGQWKSHQEVSRIIGCKIGERMYYKLLLKLSLIDLVYKNCHLSSPALSTFLEEWKKSETDKDGNMSKGTTYSLRKPDELGRVYTCGAKKCAKAELWAFSSAHCTEISDTEPSLTWPIFVNGKPMHIYFEGDIKQITSIIEPLELTSRHFSYGIWASVNGGGLKGRADALRIALARALASMEPSLRPSLEHIVKGDGRRVERKKYGQPKARRKFTWVKR